MTNIDGFLVHRPQTGAIQSSFVIETQKADNDRLLEVMTSWGEEAAWWDHRLTRIVRERDALIAWCDQNEDWFSPTFRRRNARIIFLWGMRNVAMEKLADIATIVNTLATKHPRDMGRLTEAFCDARREPPPSIRPTRTPIPDEVWEQAKGKGWTE